MAINLEKGQRQSVTSPKFTVGLGWDANSNSIGEAFDVDASVFVLGANGKLLSDNHFVYYNNLKTPDNGVIHMGDNITGDGDGDDEKVIIDVAKINAEVAEIAFVVTIHKAAEKRQNFGQIRNSFIRILDSNNTELMKYELDEDFSIETAVQFGRLYKKNEEWKFEAIGNGMKGGLQDYLNKYN
ncbi:MAG TPA: TerD family protein [Bacteroidia bacterium]|nr:TerD family protein [Bacteroidia bacterium]